MKKFLNISIIIFILISFSLVGCKNINKNSSNNASEDTEISKNLKNIKVPDKIIFYNNNDTIEITKDSKKFNDIVTQVDFSLGGIKDSLKCEANFEEENFIYNSSIGEEKEVYNKIYINFVLQVFQKMIIIMELYLEMY